MGFWRKEQISILLTTKCNLQCAYCYMPKLSKEKGDVVIDSEFAKAGIRDFFQSSQSRSVRFFAPGEPTAAFDRMCEIASIAQELDKQTTFELQTNGVFGSRVFDWISKNISKIWISCDGPPDIQARQRPYAAGGASPELVYENIVKFSELSHLQFGVRLTVSVEMLDRQDELVEYFAGLGVRNLSLMPVCASLPNPSVAAASFLEFAKGFERAYQRALHLNLTCSNLFIVNFDEDVEFYCQAMIPTPRLTPDGFVSCCDWASLGPSYLPDNVLHGMIYGRYNSSTKSIAYDSSKMDQIRMRTVAKLNEGDCRGCRALRRCAGGCLGKVASVTGSHMKVNRDWCDAVLYLYDVISIDSPFAVLNP